MLTYECAVTTRIIFCRAPRDHWHHSVMVHVQERNLPVLFTQHEEHRVEEFRDFRQEVNIDAPRHLQKR